jgi:hypothetical protein
MGPYHAEGLPDAKMEGGGPQLLSTGVAQGVVGR